MDSCVRVVWVASSCSEECGLPGPCGPRRLVELALILVHSDLIMCSTDVNVEGGKVKGMDKGNTVVRRVLNGPCTSGRGGQVISEKNSHGSKT